MPAEPLLSQPEHHHPDPNLYVLPVVKPEEWRGHPDHAQHSDHTGATSTAIGPRDD